MFHVSFEISRRNETLSAIQAIVGILFGVLRDRVLLQIANVSEL